MREQGFHGHFYILDEGAHLLGTVTFGKIGQVDAVVSVFRLLNSLERGDVAIAYLADEDVGGHHLVREL